MGVHSGDVEREQRLNVVAVEFALIDGDRHAALLAGGGERDEVKV
jgi:hypothetical protein